MYRAGLSTWSGKSVVVAISSKKGGSKQSMVEAQWSSSIRSWKDLIDGTDNFRAAGRPFLGFWRMAPGRWTFSLCWGACRSGSTL